MLISAAIQVLKVVLTHAAHVTDSGSKCARIQISRTGTEPDVLYMFLAFEPNPVQLSVKRQREELDTEKYGVANQLTGW